MSDEEMAMTKARMTVMLDDLLSGQGKLRYTSRMPFILNEHAPVSKFFLNICTGSWGWLGPYFQWGWVGWLNLVGDIVSYCFVHPVLYTESVNKKLNKQQIIATLKREENVEFHHLWW